MSEKLTLESIVGERLAAMVREKYPVTSETVVIQLVAQEPGRYQDYYNIPYWYLREGGYIHKIPRTYNVMDTSPAPIAPTADNVELGKFELWAEGKNKFGQLYNVHWLTYVRERDMLFIA